MASETETLLSQRLKGLCVEPPDAAGFSASLRARLEAELAGKGSVVQIPARRLRPKRVFSRRLGVLLSAAAILVGGSALALVGPKILQWVGFKEPEARWPGTNSQEREQGPFENQGPAASLGVSTQALPEEATPAVTDGATSAQSEGLAVSSSSSEVSTSVASEPKRAAVKPAPTVGTERVNPSTSVTTPAQVPETPESVERVRVPKLSIDLGRTNTTDVENDSLPEVRPIEVPRLDPERPRVTNPDTNQLRDNSLRETLRRNRAGKSD